ncbi:MAG: cyclic peptide export ABC transporter [Fluviicola sp.]|nr:cyclic peptide export ABC transporter [Fluviicola sp.]
MLRVILSLIGRWGLIKYVALGIFSGLCSFLFITLLTGVMDLLMKGAYTDISQEYIVIFAFVILLFVWSRKILSTIIIKYTQVLLWKLRKDVISTVLKSDYQQFYGQKSKILTAITNNVYAITEASMQVINFTTETVLAVACLIFMAVISPSLCFITIGFAIVGITIYQLGSRKIERNFETSLNLEVKFQGKINDILNGFKEIHMEPSKGQHIYENQINEIANQAIKSNLTAYTRFINSQVIGHILFYVLMSVTVLIFSVLLEIQNTRIINFVFTLLYFLASIQSIMAILPTISKAMVASSKLIVLQNDLKNARYSNDPAEKAISMSEFERVSAEKIDFFYTKESETFGIKEIDFELKKGEIVFIYGGNGSGKTTFINTLLGLYKHSSGVLKLNNEVIDETNYNFYRTAFSVVFNDFYLFDELYKTPDKESWNSYLTLFELDGKVELNGNKLSTTDLSTGQRKRLALILAIVEEKPIIVLDEWAADQDPNFRNKFYRVILPLLKERGFTVLAVTHDDHYYECADRLFKMCEGKLSEETSEISFFRKNS